MTQKVIDDLKIRASQLDLLSERAEKKNDETTVVLGSALKSICEALIEIGGPATPQGGRLPGSVTTPTPPHH